MEKRCTKDAFLGICLVLFEALNKNMCTGSLFVDISKAFDNVKHEILVDRLCEAGIRGIPLVRFKSYLTSRIQRVKIQRAISLRKFVAHGIPPGSVLGLIAFRIYINNLEENIFPGD